MHSTVPLAVMETLAITEIDRDYIKEQRKLRKERKKEERKQKKQQEKDRIKIQLQPSYSRVKIVKRTPCTEINSDIYTADMIEDFPLIGEKKFSGKKDRCIPTNSNQMIDTNKKTSNSSKVQLETLINQKRHTFHETKSKDEKEIYSGNPLDASKPIRMVGKHHEVPKQKRLTKLKAEIVKNKIDSVNLISYCEVNECLNEAVTRFLEKIVHFQQNTYRKDPIKGKIKRRYVVGFHEIKKYLLVKKIRFIIIATDVKIYSYNDELYKTMMEIVDLAKQNEIKFVFALKRSKIGRLTLKHLPVSCVGIFNYDGAEQEYTAIMNASSLIKETKGENDVYKQFLNQLMDCLIDS